MSKVRDFAEIISAGIAADDAGLGNVTNESKATMFTSPTFTGTPISPSLNLTPTTTANAPAGTKGALYYDSDEETLMQHDGTAWTKIYAPTTPTGSGGTETFYSGYKIHTFTADGTFTILNGPMIADILIVAGGGGGGSRHGGGGGAGELIYLTKQLTADSYSIDIGPGGGGAAGGSATQGSKGTNTIAFGSTAEGGGYGTSNGTNPGGAGGSGGGSRGNGASSANGGVGSGNSGGTNNSAGSWGNDGGKGDPATSYTSGGGGGGAGAVGATPINNDATTAYGGAGLSYATTFGTVGPASGIFAGGGGGAGPNNLGATGGIGGGGSHIADATGGSGVNGTGGGGAAGGMDPNWPGGSGGSGIVVIRYTV